MLPIWLLAVALSAGTAAPAAPASDPDYDLVWTAFAREVRWQQGDSRPVAAGRRSGPGRGRLTPARPGVLRLEWRGEGGDSSRLIGPAGPTNFTFPSPLVIA